MPEISKINTRCVMLTLIQRGFDICCDTHASKVHVWTIKQIFYKVLTTSWNIISIITKIYVILGTTVSTFVLEKRHTNIISCLHIIHCHYTSKCHIQFDHGISSVPWIHYCIKQLLFYVKKHIFCMKPVIIQYIKVVRGSFLSKNDVGASLTKMHTHIVKYMFHHV